MILRRIRAVFVTALVWACLWLPVGVVAGIYRSFRLQSYDGVPVALPTLEQLSLAILVNVAAWMSWGALSGAVFAVLLAFMEQRRDVSTLSFPRTAALGTVGAIAVPAVVLAMNAR